MLSRWGRDSNQLWSDNVGQKSKSVPGCTELVGWDDAQVVTQIPSGRYFRLTKARTYLTEVYNQTDSEPL